MKKLENKYYTPSIEEFYIGFEYESKKADKMKSEFTPQTYSWKKEKYNPVDYIYAEIDGEIDFYLLDCIKDKDLRVKYLDKEDIESLGFIKTTENWNEYWNDFIQEFDWGVIKIRVHEKNRTKLLIYCLSKDNNSRCLFEGGIKNISELKLLLKQLGI